MPCVSKVIIRTSISHPEEVRFFGWDMFTRHALPWAGMVDENLSDSEKESSGEYSYLDIENTKFSTLRNKYFTIVVFPAPEGAEKIIHLPLFGLSIIKGCLKFVL